MNAVLCFVLATCVTALVEGGGEEFIIKGDTCSFLPNEDICSIYGMSFVEKRYCGWFQDEIICRKVFSGKWERNSNPNTLKIVSYNVRELPHLLSRAGERERTCRIPDDVNRKFPDADVIVFQELFHKGCLSDRANMAHLLRPYGYHWSYQPLDNDIVDFPKFIGAGLMIASKFPIIKSSFLAFSVSDLTTTDVLSKKGVIYAKIQKNGTAYHIFNTHLQATNSWISVSVRLDQVKAIKAFKDKLNIPVNEAVIFAGDFNEAYTGTKGNMPQIMKILDAEMAKIEGPLRYTFNSASQLASGGGASAWFDYILISKSNKIPKRATMTAYKIEHPSAFGYCSFSIKLLSYTAPNSKLCSKTKSTKELSDHYPIQGSLTF